MRFFARDDMDPQNWLERMQKIVETQDWEAMSELRKQTNEHFAKTFDYEGLRQFYSTAMRCGLDAERSARLSAADSSQFQATIGKALVGVKAQLAQQSKIRGVYFEYYYDGTQDGSNTGNFFLCSAYSETEDGWGSEFEEDGFVDGAEIPDFFFFDADWEWDGLSRSIAEEAANGRLLAAVLEEWKASSITGIPLGFANHDHEMVRAPMA